MTDMMTTPDGEPISRFCFGTMQFGAKADRDASRAMYDACREAGINFFDTAFGYNEGASERLLGEFARSERQSVFLATKCAHPGDSSAANITAQFDASRRRLGVDAVDLLYLHRWDDHTPLEETFDALTAMVHAGSVRRVGVSNFSAWQTMKAVRVAESRGLRIAATQPMFSLVKRQAEVEIIPMARSEQIAVVPYSPLGGGLLSGKYVKASAEGRLAEDPMYSARYGQDWMHSAAAALSDVATECGVSPITLAVAWVAAHPGVTAPIISGRSKQQLKPSLAAMSYALDDALHARLTALTPTPPPATDRSEEA